MNVQNSSDSNHRTKKNAPASMEFSGPLNALSVSPNKNLVAVGGRDVLKIISIENTGFVEKRNLRVGKANLNFSTNDVRWHPLQECEHLLATAATNGAVVIWNLRREGFKQAQDRILNDHNRAVNRICWHPTDGNVLLTGSQDSTVKLWDKRGKCTLTYKPKSESVRDIQFNPFQTSKFAAAFENGTVQVWDLRKTPAPEHKFTAHSGLVLALDWHPKQAFTIATGSRDRTVKIWDLLDCRQPQQTIQTIASVGRVQWRPSFSNQIATSASLMDNSIHIWDIHHPNVPLASLEGHADVASGIQWMDTPISKEALDTSEVHKEGIGYDIWQHMISCSRDCSLQFHSLANAYMPNKHMRTLALALNPCGKIASTFSSIDRSNKFIGLAAHHPKNNNPCIYSVPEIPQPISRSTSSDNQPSFGIGAFTDNSEVQVGAATLPLISRQGSPSRFVHEPSLGLSVNHTSPSPFLPQEAVLSIWSMRENDNYKEENIRNRTDSDENAAIIFGFDRDLFCFFANQYILFGKSFRDMCDHNAQVAQTANQHEMYQVWQILKLLYESSPDEGSDHIGRSSANRGKLHNIEEPSAPNQITLLLQELDQVNPQAMQDFEPSPYEVDSTKPNFGGTNLASISSDMASSSSSLPAVLSSPLGRLRDATVKELLEYYCDLGDVQTCVAIASVINSVNGIENVINSSWLQELYVYYIDLLHQFQLYSAANELISQCCDRGIRQMNMKSTTIYSNCANCNKSLDVTGRQQGRCLSCRNFSAMCSLCQQPVKGLYVWCPVCCHGGHLDHLTQWFSKHQVCPTGCWHNCSPFISKNLR